MWLANDFQLRASADEWSVCGGDDLYVGSDNEADGSKGKYDCGEINDC